MCNEVIWFIQAKYVAGKGKATRRKWFLKLSDQTFTVFTF